MRAFRLSLVLVPLIVAGCVANVSEPTAEQKQQGESARQLLANGQYQQAAKAWNQLAQDNRNAADYFHLKAADAWSRADNLSRVKQQLDHIHRDQLKPDDASRYDLLHAQLALHEGDAEQALQLTTRPQHFPDAQYARAAQLHAQAQAQTGKKWAAAQTRAILHDTLESDARARNREHIMDLLGSLNDKQLRQRSQNLTRDDVMRPWLQEALNQAGVTTAPTIPEPGMAVDESDATGKMPDKVALIVPLSGPFAAAGKAIKQGFLAAYFDDTQARARKTKIEIRDGAGDASEAIAAYTKAVEHGADMVVGPLARQAVQAIADQDSRPVPLLALNHPVSNQLPPAHMTEFALRPEMEGAQVADHMLNRGLQHAIILTGDSSFADRAGQAFQARFDNGGGHVDTTRQLPDGGVDYSGLLDSMSLQAASADSTGIFLAMPASQARLLIPQLRVRGNRLPLFATSHIYNNQTDPVSNHDLNGVTFDDAPWLFGAQPGLPSHSTLASQLAAARGGSARLFAFGMDAWSLIPYLDYLHAHPGDYLRGATGRLTADHFGRLHRIPIWVRFSNGLARPASGSLQRGPINNTEAAPALPASSQTPPDTVPAGE